MITQRGWAVWLTGLPASGKTTLARAMHARLRDNGVVAAVLDSDALRPLLSPGHGYTASERAAFYHQLTELAVHLTSDGVNVLIAATAHRRAFRQQARARLQPFAEVWVRCELDVCRTRDPKHLYQRANTGVISDLPGIGVPYEPPDQPDVVVNTDQHTPEAAAAYVIAALPWTCGTLREQGNS